MKTIRNLLILNLIGEFIIGKMLFRHHNDMVDLTIECGHSSGWMYSYQWHPIDKIVERFRKKKEEN